ncbi:MAG: hypothetical protein ISR76_08500 [Planctomycetes bacterium]|nr:hypothetical protein [Planctomycetota bacterium]MBL7009023.1 hypothetical protein [Planctomycetota bacterium]
MTRSTPRTLLLPVLGLLTLGSSGCGVLGAADTSYRPEIDPADFVDGVSNPYFPLVPGTTCRFAEGEGAEVVVTVTHETRTILGIRCVVVHDVVLEDGQVVEDTFDWYAQDRTGNVWYMGEDTKEYHKNGRVSTAGSWEAGVGGAQPGIIMHAEPVPGGPYRQEYFLGEAEDMGQVVALGETVEVPHGGYTGCVKTKEWSMLESGHEFKWYARGVGFVRAEGTGGDLEVLVSVERE